MDKADKNILIAAIVTQNQNSIHGGGVPVFIVHNREELQKLSSRLERILDSSAHEINQQTIIIVSR